MYIKIYFGSKPLFLCDTIDAILEPFIHHDDAVFIDELNVHTVKTMIHEMGLEKVHAGVFYHPSLDELKKAFFKKFTVIVAAGGLVQNEKKEVLLIFRKGFWDLPKGKLDKGESIPDCAVREVMEETALSAIKLEEPLIITYHTYQEGTKSILKESHWFSMKAKGNQDAKPQTEEGITEVKWVSFDLLKTYFSRAFPSVVDVLHHFLAK